MADRQAAPTDGIQIYNGVRFRAIRGELMMPGATFVDPVEEAAQAKAKAEAAAAQAEADAAAAAAKTKGGKGPSETTESTGPAQTS